MKEGDFVVIDFVGKVVNTDEIFDLTKEDVAKSSNIHFEHKKYEPILVIIGSNMMVKGVDKQLLTMKVGETKKFIVPFAEGFGKRNPQLVKILSMSKFIQQNINPTPGAFVTIDNHTAKVQSVSGGRVRVDFNNPLSSKDLEYEITVVKQITDTKEKADAFLNQSEIDAKTELKEDSLEIKTKIKLNNVIEKMVTESIKKHITDIKNVNFSTGKSEPEKEKKDPK